MAHRPEDVATLEAETEASPPEGVVVRLVDVEPFAGLVAAVARFSTLLTPEVYAVLPMDATEALSDVQGIMWRLEHAIVERV